MKTLKTLILALCLAALAAPGTALAAPPPNDAFANADDLAGDSGDIFGSNSEATKEAGEPDHAGNTGGASVWYRWTAARPGRIVLSSCDSDFDAALAVYTGTAVSALTHVASTGDCTSVPEIEFLATPGVQYYVAIDGKDGATGDFFLYFFQRPANDDRAFAHEIAGESGFVEVSNSNGSVEPGEAEHGGPGGASVWFRWTAPTSGPVRFDTCKTGYDTLMGAYEGGSPTPFATSDDHHCGAGSVIGFAAEAGKEYFIAVDGYEGDWIAGPLYWSRSPVEPYNVARPTISGIPQEGSTLTASDGTWTGTPPISFTYSWARCNAAATFCQFIPGADGPTLVLTAFDVSSRIRAFVTAANGAGSSQVNSGATPPVAPRSHAAPQNTGAPTISGPAVEEAILTGSAGGWDGYPAPVFSFQWESCSASGTGCEEIAGETEPTLRLSIGEVGRRIRLTVVARNTSGAAVAHSAFTAVVARRSAAVRCVVPNVRGKTVRSARAAIRKRRCSVGRVRRRFSTGVRAGRVVSQTPRPGARLAPGARVHLVVSRGRRR